MLSTCVVGPSQHSWIYVTKLRSWTKTIYYLQFSPSITIHIFSSCTLSVLTKLKYTCVTQQFKEIKFRRNNMWWGIIIKSSSYLFVPTLFTVGGEILGYVMSNYIYICIHIYIYVCVCVCVWVYKIKIYIDVYFIYIYILTLTFDIRNGILIHFDCLSGPDK